MPIKAENRSKYPPNWGEISKRVRHERAGNRCERCGAPNGQVIARGAGPNAGTYMVETGDVYDDDDGSFLGAARGSEYLPRRFVKVVLTVGHINHDPADCADSNLRAWCQKCHLAHDQEHHQRNARATRRGRKAARELFDE